MLPTDWLDGIGMEEDDVTATRLVPNEAGRRDAWGSPFADDIIETLMEAGWTVTDNHKAVGEFYVATAPVGVASWGGAKVDADCSRKGIFSYDLTTNSPGKDDLSLVAYDPLKQNAPPCPNYQLGLTPSDTLDNLIAAIGTYTEFDAALDPDYYLAGLKRVVLTAKSPGTDWNNWGFYATNWATGGAATGGGGKTLQSPAYRGRSFTLKVTELGGGDEHYRVALLFDGSITQRIRTRRQRGSQTNSGSTIHADVYRIIASKHQLCIYAPAGDPGTASQLLASIPWSAYDSEPVKVVIGHNKISPAQQPGGQPGLRDRLAYSYAWLEGQFVAGNAVQLGCLRGFPGYDVLTLDGDPLTCAAFIYGRGPGSKREDGRLLGKLWNGLVSLDAGNGEFGMIGGRRYARIGTQPGGVDFLVRGTFWLMIPE